ncbi:LamG-like jellyroll fold domain-containing protein [Planctomicrobium sp. SH668]|uniref:LamG-like jellyroll fold domain-containing protein n=1 Tax=Planctomicrobium sp. SH668 TaxID=3448126 RepID=UPI003F5B164D
MAFTRNFLIAVVLLLATPLVSRAEFQVGAAVVDATPSDFPVTINGGFLAHYATEVKTAINVRAFVLSQGETQVALVVVDSCMMPQDVLDEAKKFVVDRTGIPHNHICISATHTHTAPASGQALGTDPHPGYAAFLKTQIVEAIALAQSRLEPAKVGWGEIDASAYTALRRWIRRPDRIDLDIFGNPTVRANMHAAADWDNVVGESGPKDPALSLISFQTLDGRPIGVYANFSMHYFGDSPISADYFGLFAEGLKKRIAPETDFVGAMSHGCSGDIWRRDYTNPDAPEFKLNIEQYTEAMLELAMKAYSKIEYKEDPKLGMQESRITMKYRVPDVQRLEWAKRVIADLNGEKMTTLEHVYAREQILLNERQELEVILQAIAIGDLAIATTPTETYALTGLKIKLQSPFQHTMVLDLANGSAGYIPPEEQHLLGGYNTWAALSAGLEVGAERRIAEADLLMLEKLAGTSRRDYRQSAGNSVEQILKLKPAGYWRLDEFSGPRAKDASGNRRDGIFEKQVAYFLEGPQNAEFSADQDKNRAVQFVDDRLRVADDGLGQQYTISAWIWNGMPNEGRDVTGWFFSRGRDEGLDSTGDHLGIGGSSGNTGRLIFAHGSSGETLSGKTELTRWTWHHVVLVRNGEQVKVYLDGSSTPEIDAKVAAPNLPTYPELFFGGRCDNVANFEGRMDEIALFDRALTGEEVAKLFPKK